MSDARKQILSFLAGCRKQKAWNKTREKYMPVKRRHNLAETDRGSYYKEKRSEPFFNGNENDNDHQSYKTVSPILLQKLITVNSV